MLLKKDSICKKSKAISFQNNQKLQKNVSFTKTVKRLSQIMPNSIFDYWAFNITAMYLLMYLARRFQLHTSNQVKSEISRFFVLQVFFDNLLLFINFIDLIQCQNWLYLNFILIYIHTYFSWHNLAYAVSICTRILKYRL